MSKKRLWDNLKDAGGPVLLSIVGCASSFVLAKTVGSIPNRPYKVSVLENDGGMPRYDFVLFEVPDSGIELKVPRLKSHGMATSDRYAEDTAGFIS